LQRILAVHCANPSTVLFVSIEKLHPQIVKGVVTTCEWIEVFAHAQTLVVTALVYAVAVEAIA
jgi:hypothetical protein